MPSRQPAGRRRYNRFSAACKAPRVSAAVGGTPEDVPFPRPFMRRGVLGFDHLLQSRLVENHEGRTPQLGEFFLPELAQHARHRLA